MASIFVERNLQNAIVSQFLFHSDYTIYRFEVSIAGAGRLSSICKSALQLHNFRLSLPSPRRDRKISRFEAAHFAAECDEKV